MKVDRTLEERKAIKEKWREIIFSSTEMEFEGNVSSYLSDLYNGNVSVTMFWGHKKSEVYVGAIRSMIAQGTIGCPRGGTYKESYDAIPGTIQITFGDIDESCGWTSGDLKPFLYTGSGGGGKILTYSMYIWVDDYPEIKSYLDFHKEIDACKMRHLSRVERRTCELLENDEAMDDLNRAKDHIQREMDRVVQKKTKIESLIIRENMDIRYQAKLEYEDSYEREKEAIMKRYNRNE